MDPYPTQARVRQDKSDSLTSSLAQAGSDVMPPSARRQDNEPQVATPHDHELSTPSYSCPGIRDLDPQQYGVAGSAQSIAWANADVTIDRNWTTSRSICDDTYNEASPRPQLSFNTSTPSGSSSLPSQEMNYTPQASHQYQYPQYQLEQFVSGDVPPFHSTDQTFYSVASGSALSRNASLNATTRWASCSTWPSTSSSSYGQWHHTSHTHVPSLKQSYPADADYSPSSPFILPSLSRDSSISPLSNPHLFTPSSSEARLEPTIADKWSFDHQDPWLQIEQQQQNHCYQSTPEVSPTSQVAPHQFEFSPECASLLNDLMQMSTQSDAVFSGLIEAQPQFASLPPSAFDLDQMSPTVADLPVLHHPRPRRPFVPLWQCDPDYDFDQFTSSLHSKSNPHNHADALVTEPCRVSYTSPPVPEDVSSDDEVEDLVDEDSDMDVEDLDIHEWEEHSPSSTTSNYGGIAQEVHSPFNIVGPSVRLGASVLSLGPQSLLFQSVPDSVKNLYSI